jgi:hypothetical protein
MWCSQRRELPAPSAGHTGMLRLAPIAVALAALAGCTTSAGDGAAVATAPPALTSIEGVPVVDRGLVAWEDGVVLDDPHVLRVMATGLSGPPDPCSLAVVVTALRQADSEVTVEARQYEMADKPERHDCARVMLGPQAHELRLDEPLAGRTVFDAHGTVPREVIAFDDFPTVRQVPDGYVWRPPSWDDERRVVTRSWGSEEGSLTLEIGPADQLLPLPAVLAKGRLDDRVATVTRVLMLSCVRWGESDRTLNLCSRDAMAGDPPLGPDELLEVGASVA